MKKIILFALMFFCILGVAEAQVCKISGSGDNVEVYSASIENNNTVVVTVGNDSQNISANVTVTVEVTYTANGYSTKTYSFTGKGLSKPNQESIIRISIPSEKENRNPDSVKVTQISGTKCN